MKKSDKYVVFFFVALLLLFFSPVILTGRTYFIRDLLYIFHPWKTLCAEMLQCGIMPLWNPYAYSGMPLLANWQTGVFFPFSILFYIFGFTTALKMYHVSILFLSGIFAFLFGRKLGFGRWGASGMMILFAFNGYAIARLEFLSLCGTYAWMFALLLCRDMPVMLAVAAACASFAGHQILAIMIALLLFYQLARAQKRHMRHTIVALFAGIVIAAVQILPTIELVMLSSRAASGIQLAIASLNAVHPHEIARLISPWISTAAVDAIGGEKIAWQSSFYVGVIAIFVSLAAARAGAYKWIFLFSLLAAASGILLSFGTATPVYEWLYAHVWGMNMLRYPVQYMFIPVAGITMLTGIGLYRQRFGALMVIMLTLELFILSWGFQATAPDDFFHSKPRILLQNTPVQRQERINRFILSPGSEQNRMFMANDLVAAWSEARNGLYGLTSLPFHVSNAYGSGEPLTLASIERLINTAYMQHSPEAALPYYQLLGVDSLVCRKMLSPTPGYHLVFPGPPHRYRLHVPDPLVHLEGSDSPVRFSTSSSVPGRLDVQIEEGNPRHLIWKEMYVPGWRAYAKGVKIPVCPSAAGFLTIELPSGSKAIQVMYQPSAFRGGLYITLFSVLSFMLYGIIKLLKIPSLR